MNLEGYRVRWKHRGRWRHGYVGSDYTAHEPGFIRVHRDEETGTRLVPLAGLQYQTTGSRGGRHWELYEPVDPKPAIKSDLDQLEMFPEVA